GLRFFHQGQLQGRKKRISPHLGRGPDEPVDQELGKFYDKLLEVLRQPALRDGRWQLLECRPAWEGNWTTNCFIVFAWSSSDPSPDAGRGARGEGSGRLLVAVNYAPNQSQCYVKLPFADLAGRTWRLQNQLAGGVYDRDGDDLASHGLYLDMAPWQAAVFALGTKLS